MISDDVDAESQALHQMPVSKLHERFVSVYGEAPRSRNRVWLIRKILWRLQSLKGGSLSERARLRATELAADSDVHLMPAQRRPAVSVKPAEKRDRAKVSVDRRLPAPGMRLLLAFSGATGHRSGLCSRV